VAVRAAAAAEGYDLKKAFDKQRKLSTTGVCARCSTADCGGQCGAGPSSGYFDHDEDEAESITQMDAAIARYNAKKGIEASKEDPQVTTVVDLTCGINCGVTCDCGGTDRNLLPCTKSAIEDNAWFGLAWSKARNKVIKQTGETPTHHPRTADAPSL